MLSSPRGVAFAMALRAERIAADWADPAKTPM